MNGDSNVSQELVLYHLSKITEKERKKDEAVNGLRSARKAAKADGVDLKVLDAVRTLLKQDESELADGFNQTVRYAHLLNVPVYGQLTLFESPEITEETVRERGYAAGLRAGKLGQDQSTNPHDPTAPAGMAWVEGWYDGQKILLSAISTHQPVEDAPVEKPKRGRKADPVADLPM